MKRETRTSTFKSTFLLSLADYSCEIFFYIQVVLFEIKSLLIVIKKNSFPFSAELV